MIKVQFDIGRDNIDPTFIGGFVTRFLIDDHGFYVRTLSFRGYKNKI